LKKGVFHKITEEQEQNKRGKKKEKEESEKKKSHNTGEATRRPEKQAV